jgi:hypothetical protein
MRRVQLDPSPYALVNQVLRTCESSDSNDWSSTRPVAIELGPGMAAAGRAAAAAIINPITNEMSSTAPRGRATQAFTAAAGDRLSAAARPGAA